MFYRKNFVYFFRLKHIAHSFYPSPIHGDGFCYRAHFEISFANIGAVTDWIELNFGMCITNIHTNVSTTGFVKILLHC